MLTHTPRIPVSRILVRAALSGLLTLQLAGGVSAQSQEPMTPPAANAEEPVSAEEPINTDRPDVGTSASTVGAGRFQVETGFQYARDGGEEITTFPTLLRYGVADRWELRLETDLINLRSVEVDHFADIVLGTKVTLHDGDSTKLGLLFNLNLPVGPEDLAGSVDPELVFLWDQQLSESWSMGINGGIAVTEDDQNTSHALLSWASGFSYAFTDSADVYIEAFGEGPDGAHGHYYVGADTEVLFRPTDNLQLDVYYLRGLSSFGPEWGAGTGLSARF